MRIIRIFALLALVLPCLAVGCGEARRSPDVVLITLDTLRADRLGAYGARGISTPNLDRLAAEGVVFDRAATPMPLTVPAHASILTGAHPRDHGVLNQAIALAPERVTLAEALRDRGYRTGAFVAASLLGRASGMDQGFEVFSTPSAPQRRAEEVVNEALGWLASQPPAQPLFLWVHLFDPHLPYAPPAPHNAAALARSRGRWPSLHWPDFERLARRHDHDLPAEVLGQARALYDGEVEYTDHWVGILREGIERRGAWRESLVVVAADHGECFENGIFFEHADCLYQGAIRVPLIVLFPHRDPAGVRVTTQVDLTDIAPTVLRSAAASLPPDVTGHPLGAAGEARGADRAVLIQQPVERARPAERRRARLETIRRVAGEPTRDPRADGELTGLVTAAWKYLRGERSEALFQLGAAPDETSDRTATAPAVADEMRRRLRAELRRHPIRASLPERDDEELAETLRALGYL